MNIEQKHYNNLDGLRALAALGIVCMHVRSNLGFEIIFGGGIGDYIVNSLISQFGSFISMFMILSGFAMCCGYYERIKNNQINLNDFYNKRYLKILPYFAVLVFADVAVSFLMDGGIGLSILYEAFADLTLMFGFYAVNGIDVIGVGWTLGVIFGFYILFPFFVYLIWTKKRAWLSLVVTIAIAYITKNYFGGTNSLTFAHLHYFVIGGIIYLYRQDITNLMRNKYVSVATVLLGFAFAFMLPGIFAENTISRAFGFTLMVVGAIGAETKLWSNPFTKFISGISFEIYLAHMLMFRVMEKIHLTTVFGENVKSYVLTCIATATCAIVFAVMYKRIEISFKK